MFADLNSCFIHAAPGCYNSLWLLTLLMCLISASRVPQTTASRSATTGAGESSAPGPTPAAAPSSQPHQPEALAPSSWLSEVLPRKTPYFPQMGDEVRVQTIRENRVCWEYYRLTSQHRSFGGIERS